MCWKTLLTSWLLFAVTFKIIYSLLESLARSFVILIVFLATTDISFSLSARIIIFLELTSSHLSIDPPPCRRVYTHRRTRLIRAWIVYIFTLARGCTRCISYMTQEEGPLDRRRSRNRALSSSVFNLAKKKCEHCYVTENWKKTDNKKKKRKNGWWKIEMRREEKAEVRMWM